MDLNSKNILIISPESWGSNFVSKHHYALELSLNGNKVYFLNPPTPSYLRSALKLFFINENLTVIDYTLFKGINRLPTRIKKLLYLWKAREILNRIGSQPDIVWSFDPYVFQELSCFGNEAIKIYHCVDFCTTHLELEVAQNADLILGTSKRMLQRFDRLNTNVHKIGHGLSREFIRNSDCDLNIHGTAVRVGYIGNLLSNYIDWDTLITLVMNYPQIEFYFIGPLRNSNLGNFTAKNEVKIIQEQKNVFLLGEMNTKELAQKLPEFDFFIMLYKSDIEIALDNPHKVLEYLSTGKTVVMNYTEEYKDSQNLVEMVSDNSEFIERFDAVSKNLDLFNSIKRRQKRIEFSHSNSYKNKISKIEDILYMNN